MDGRKQAKENIRIQMQRLAALGEITLAITSTLDLNAVLDVLLEKIDFLLPYSAATVRLLNRQSGEFEPVACRNINVDDWRAGSGRGLIREIMETKAPVMSTDVQRDPRARDPEFFRKHGLLSFLAVPLIVKGEILGILSFYTRKQHQFSNEEVEFLSMLANHVSIAIHNSQLHAQIKMQALQLEKDIAQIQQLERQQAESEKLAAAGRMAARIAHEINNPLAGIKNSFLLIKDVVSEDYPYYQYVGRIEKEIDRIARVVRQMFDLYRPDQESASEFLVDEAISDVSALLEADARRRGVAMEVEARDASVLVAMPEGLLRQVLYNIILNAIDASPDGGTVKITPVVREGILTITISDRGSGIPEEVRSRIFEPFFTTKGDLSRAGLGLGLSVSKSLVQSMGGTLDFESEVGQGTIFRIILPLGGVQKDRQNG